MAVPAITIYRIADGKIVESWWGKDYLGLVQQMGALPLPPKTEADFSNVFFTSLSAGLNMISLPLKPQTPYTTRSFAEELSATGKMTALLTKLKYHRYINVLR